ncbi:MAG: permease-like cell division protein FtsX [bacterium]|nr:permease-like cell division protein FtsX [bacterium]
MFTVNLKRVFNNAWLSFKRNGLLSTATIVIMTMALFVIGGILLLSVVSNAVLADLEKKIDISVYFIPGADESQILKIQKEIAARDTVSKVDYISQDEALAAFKEKHKGDEIISTALDELGNENPLGAVLNVRAQNPNQLAGIAQFLQSRKYDVVDKINYFENQDVIERLSAVVSGVRNIGLVIALVLSFVAVLVAFNTVRLAIYTSREEINIMKLVGASNWFVRSPFLVTGLMHGGFSALITSFLFLPIIWAASPKVSFLLPGINLFGYFISNFYEFFLIIAATGVILGVGSSALAVRKYLKI